MNFSIRSALFYFDQYFTVRLGEKVYVYPRASDNLTLMRSAFSLLRAWIGAVAHRTPGSHSVRRSAGRHLFYIETINQRSAVINLLRQMPPDRVVVVLNNEINRVDLAFPPPMNQWHWDARPVYARGFFWVVKAYFLSTALRSKYQGRVAGHHIVINFALFLSAVAQWEQWLLRLQPVSVTVLNDHNLFPLSLMLAARRSRTRSVYIQHASVSDVFPKLLANTALLEGQHALDTYNRLGNLARVVKLVGIPRLDSAIGFHGGGPIPDKVTVGFCLKTFYTPQQVEGMLAAIRASSRVSRIVLRPHPGSPKRFWDSILEKYPGDVSDSRKEDAVTFLRSVDVLVSGESTIVLEAALMKMPSIHFDDGSFFFPFDMYGLVRHGVAYASVNNPSGLTAVIDSLDKQRVQACFLNGEYYCSTINTRAENRSVEILLQFYHEID